MRPDMSAECPTGQTRNPHRSTERRLRDRVPRRGGDRDADRVDLRAAFGLIAARQDDNPGTPVCGNVR